jgi:nucleolar protein 58
VEATVAEDIKAAAQVSMGTELAPEDVQHIQELCAQTIEIAVYREQLYEYIKNRMRAVAPNLTILVGELVGARLIAHAGSLLNLAKYPASTVQILGAEKALFRALKSKKQTPKYGLIYHASLVGQTAPKFKGKVTLHSFLLFRSFSYSSFLLSPLSPLSLSLFSFSIGL